MKSKLSAMELIGLNAQVINSTDSTKIGLKGEIWFETKNVFTLMTENGLKIIPKKENIFEIKNEIINGNEILFRPEQRTKKVIN